MENVFEVSVEPKEGFYPLYKRWCRERDFPCIPIQQIDSVFVCYKGGIEVYSCFFWNTASTLSVIGFPFSNPFVPMEEKEGGLDFLLKAICEQAKSGGYEMIWTTSDTPRVVESMLNAGFGVADTSVDQYYKTLF